MCGNRETGSVIFTGPECGCIRKCWNGNAMICARRLRKQNRSISRGRQKLIEKAREDEKSRETKGNRESQKKKKGKTAEVNPAITQCSHHIAQSYKRKILRRS